MIYQVTIKKNLIKRDKKKKKLNATLECHMA